MNIRVTALPEEAADFLLWLDRHKGEVQIVSCSQAYAITRCPRVERIRHYIQLRLSPCAQKGERHG